MNEEDWKILRELAAAIREMRKPPPVSEMVVTHFPTEIEALKFIHGTSHPERYRIEDDWSEGGWARQRTHKVIMTYKEMP